MATPIIGQRIVQAPASGKRVVAACVLLGVGAGALCTVAPPLLTLGIAFAVCFAVFALARPGAAILTVALLVLITEDDAASFFRLEMLYEPSPYGLSALNVSILLCGLGVILRRRRRGSAVVGLGSLQLPLIVLLVLVPLGVFLGASAGGTMRAMSNEFAGIYVMVFVAWTITNFLENEHQMAALARFVGLIIVFRSALSLWAFVTGRGTPLYEGSSTSTSSLDPATNWLRVATIVGLVAAGALRALRWWAVLVLALAPAAALYLSFRRSFLLGLGVALFALVVVLAVRSAGARLAVLALVAGLAFVVANPTLGTGSSTSTGREIISLGNLGHDRTFADSYRRIERRNVFTDLRDQPFGLGFGVPYTVRYALPDYVPGIQAYVHMAPLWYWMKLGMAGALAYLVLLVVAFGLAIRAALSAQGPWFRAAMLGAGAGVVALAFADLTASFTGVDPRYSIVAGALFGLISAGERFTRPAVREQ